MASADATRPTPTVSAPLHHENPQNPQNPQSGKHQPPPTGFPQQTRRPASRHQRPVRTQPAWGYSALTRTLRAGLVALLAIATPAPLFAMGPHEALSGDRSPRQASQPSAATQGEHVPFHSELPPPSYPQLTLRRTPTPVADESLWPLVRASLQMDHHLDNKRVQQELDWLRKHPDFVQRLAKRITRYAPFIYRELERRDLPGELLFVAMIESALDPFAFSPGGAAGLWQFMPATGKRFGLKVDWWADERRDPELSTQAALDYLELLHRRFDNWELAIAAYNAGEGRISRAVRRAGSKNFFELRVPKETAGYLPRLFAFAEAFSHPQRYDISLPEVSARVRVRVVQTGSQMDLSRAAQALGVSLDSLYDWNPALNQWATHPAGPHRLLVGSATSNPQLAIDQIPVAERLAWRRHTIVEGDSLGVLAARYHTDTQVLMKANNLNSHLIHTGDSLLIPTGAQAGATTLPARRRSAGQKTYRVVRGDSMWEIARRFDVSQTRLMRLNQIGPTQHLRVGQSLIIPSSSEGVVKQIKYRVRKGDSLSRIAQRFNVTTTEILGWNELDLAKYLQPGQQLRLYVDLTVAH